MLATVTVLLAAMPAGFAVATQHEQVTITRGISGTGLELGSYTLITDNLALDRPSAEAILDVKAAWPKAMRAKDETLFRRVLSDAFTFRAHGQLYDRDAYIRDRLSRQERVETAVYDNVVLQILGPMAVLTYNVSLVTESGGIRVSWHGSWADVFVRDGQWQVRASHLISERVEKDSPSKCAVQHR